VEEIAADGADDPFGERVLPWAAWRGDEFLDGEGLHGLGEPHAEDGIAVAEEEARDRGQREGLAELVRGPLRSRVLGDAEVEELAAPVDDDQEPVACAIVRARRVYPGGQAVSARASGGARV